MKLTENNFQMIVRYGGIALLVSGIASVYLVMRHVELYRDAARADQQYQIMALRQQALQGVLQDFVARANSDPGLAEILQRGQIIVAAPAAVPGGPEGIRP